jgi:hypothetical protein
MPQRKGRESNPQGRQARPPSERVPSPLGWPFRPVSSGRCRARTCGLRRVMPALWPAERTARIAPTRTRTRHSPLEAGRDLRFTIGAHLPTGTRTRDSPLGPGCDPPLHHREPAATGQGFEPSRRGRAHSFVRIEARPAVSGDLPFVACQWTRRESNPDLRHARAVSYRWTMGPRPFNQWTAGESNPDLLRARQASFRWTSSPVPGRPHEFLPLPPGEGRGEGHVAGAGDGALTLTLSRGGL